jgi:SNF2 family DNA or RNA helicase
MTTTRVEMELVNGQPRVTVRFPYSEDAVARVKSISGARWNKPGRFWHFPLDLTACAMLREAFPNLTIGPDLWKWAAAQKREREELGSFHKAVSAEPVDLPILRTSYPTMWAAMQARGYQTLVPAYAKRVGSYFNGSQPGTGKTIETLASLAECERHGNILVVAPKKAIQSTWPREIGTWLAPDASVSYMVCDSEQGRMEERNTLLAEFAADPGTAKFRFVLIHPEMLSWKFLCDYVKPNGRKCDGKSKTCPQRASHSKVANYPALFDIAWDAVIMDETHKMMMHANERSGSVSGWGYGAQKLNAKGALKIGMSGTPFKGRPRRFWPMLHWLAPERYTGQHKWERTYFEVESNFWASSGETVTDRMREDRKELFYSDLSSIMIRHTKRELREINPTWAPPEKLHVDVRLAASAKQRKAYEGMIKDASARLLNGELTADGILAERTRLRQFANAYGQLDAAGNFQPALPSTKWEWIVDALEERGLAKGMNDGNVKIVIASQFVSILKLMGRELDALGIKHFDILGETKNVAGIEAAWQSDSTDVRVLLLSKAAGGFSLTLDAADDLVIMEPAENPDDDEQVADRVHRTSRTDHQVTIYNLVTEETIDDSIASGNLSMDLSQKAVLDGRRGVEFARLTLEGGKA